ncbi:M90 family metallopeptidase [Parapedobacter tibetensis]|uniref:M90 family metallopeptidase n=1 Tax=Parapedobacter tibetensis TaxID=2972951 RepID=UPI00214D9BD6|nr:M90 family metallopeptidase [Parapedobacter tibetensis]
MIYISTGIVALIIIGYLFSRKQKVPDLGVGTNELDTLLIQHVAFYKKLSDTDKKSFLSRASDFLSYVRIEGVGLTPEPLDRALVAASAIIPIFAFEGWRYPNITNVILYPDTFNQEFQYEGADRNTLGMVGTGAMNGQMLLSQKGLRAGFSADDGHNTGIHEFVHLLDKTDGNTDGKPEYLLDEHHLTPWVRLMHREMQRIASGKSDIDAYAMTNEAEFFAVISEYFFEKPAKLKEKHPELYELLEEMFNGNRNEE